jgi:hypothetical protein
MRIVKFLAVFWLFVVPLGFVVLMFGPMFAPPGKPYVESHCDATCMDELLAD